jgi:hypothetical protein
MLSMEFDEFLVFDRPWKIFHVTGLPKITLAGDLQGNNRSEKAEGSVCSIGISGVLVGYCCFPISDGSVER